MQHNVRIILYHKQSTSARTLFLRLNNTVCLFDGLPTLSAIKEEYDNVLIHPAAVLKEVQQRLKLPANSLKIDEEFQAKVDAPEQPIPVLLASFTQIDPPRDLVAPAGGQFIAITEARQLPQTELQLLRLAYQAIMEG